MFDLLLAMVDRLGLFGVGVLTFLENLVPSVPSEVVLPLAGFQAGQGRFPIAAVILAGAAGSVLGSLALYTLGRLLGAERLKAWAEAHGRWVTVAPEDIDKVTGFFQRHGRWAVLLGRLAPGARILVSIPAGVSGMPLPDFLLSTAVGVGLWSAGFAGAGYLLRDDYALIDRWMAPVSAVVFGLLVLGYLYRLVTFRRATPAAE